MLEELVRSNTALTTNNAKFSAPVDSLIVANEQIYSQVGNQQSNKNTRTLEDTPAPP